MKLFACDMDGTLLSHDFSISPRNLAAIKRLATADITFAIATGRCYDDVIAILERHGLHCPVVCSNGSCAYDALGLLVSKRTIQLDTLAALCGYMEEHGIFYGINSTRNLSTTPNWEKLLKKDVDECNLAVFKGMRATFLSQTGIRYVDSFKEFLSGKSDACSVSIVCLNQQKLDGLHDLITEMPSLYLTTSGMGSLEITPVDCSKATGLADLCGAMGIAADGFAAIGDSYNDLEMLKTAKISFAMGNAPQDIQHICTYVTLPCDEDGVAVAIEQLLGEEL